MKKGLLIIILINVFILTTKAQNAVISATNMNILYRGFDNPIEISVPNVSSDEIKVTISNGTIKKQSDGIYIVNVSETDETTLTVKTEKKITKKRFVVEFMPNPIPRFGGFRDGFISLGKFQSANEMILKVKGSVIPSLPFRIDSYSVFIKSKGDEKTQFFVTGAVISEEVKERFRTLQVDDVVIFFDVSSIYSVNTGLQNLGSLSYIMK
jgi:hypothetical protein